MSARRALLPYAALRASLALFRKRPGLTLSLGVALFTSLGAIFCGLGIVAGPWFLCELFGLQIALGTNGPYPPKRTRAWLSAAGIQAVAVSVLGTISFLSLLALGPDVLLGGISLGAPTEAESLSVRFGVLFLAGSLVIALSVYFEYAPAILIDKGGGLHAALLESARLVAATGPFRSWITSLFAHSLQMAPGIFAISFAASNASLESTLRWGAVLMPVVSLCLALGQGMLVASYLHVRPLVTRPADVPPEAAPSKSYAFVWSLLLLGVMSGPLLVLFALTKPAPPVEGRMPEDARVVLTQRASENTVRRYLPESALELLLSHGSVAVVASDGGGVGALPLPFEDLHIEEVRAARPRRLPEGLQNGVSTDDTFALEIRIGPDHFLTTFVDEAGVRLDDSLRRRLQACLPAWAPIVLCACLLWTALWIPRALPSQANIRRKLSEQVEASAASCAQSDATGYSYQQRAELKSALRQSALLASIWLVPATLCSLWLGLWAALS